MRTFITAAFLSVAMLVGAFAQDGGGQRRNPEERAKAEAQRMKEQLALTDSQAVKFEKISTKFNQLRREAFQNREDTAAMRKKMVEVESKMNEEVKAILTPEQYEKYLKIVAERRNRMGGPRGERGQGGPKGGGGDRGPGAGDAPQQ